MIITLSGMPGSGKTTVAKIIVEKLKLKHYYMGGIRRDVARQRGMSIDEFNKLGETDPSTDNIVDDYLVKLGKTEDNFLAEGRTAAHFIPNSMKIFMDVDPKVAAERIMKDILEKGQGNIRNESAGMSLAEEVEKLKTRTASDQLRYQKYYSINIFDRKMYDLWIDTTRMSPEDVVDMIVKFVKSKQSSDKSTKQ